VTRIKEDQLWTWVLPDRDREIHEGEWRDHGGKWIIFDRKQRTEHLAMKLENYIDAGDIQSAKYWNKDPSAICVYSLYKDRNKVWDILKGLDAGRNRVWEYDYAWGKNIQRTPVFLYSQFSKFRTILQSHGCKGTLQLIREVLPRTATKSSN
jgi:hypothetical protein